VGRDVDSESGKCKWEGKWAMELRGEVGSGTKKGRGCGKEN
jgi:hypothetical protein